MFFQKRAFFLFGVGLLLSGLSAGPVHAEEPVYHLTIKDHQFEPKELEIPAGVKVKLVVENLDKSPEEFESYDLNREKVIPGGKKATIFLGPLKPRTYKFFGEFNPKTAQGIITVKE